MTNTVDLVFQDFDFLVHLIFWIISLFIFQQFHLCSIEIPDLQHYMIFLIASLDLSRRAKLIHTLDCEFV